MFEKIFLEEHLWQDTGSKNHLKAKKILDFFKQEPILINKIENYFGKVEKPYLQKRTNLNLFLGEKKGKLVKPAPPAYGFNSDIKHYYFIYSYNCIYECEYCYLQGYFKSPDIVFFLNYEDIIKEMETVVKEFLDEDIWFHGGEFSDSLALSQITNEWPLFWDFFEKYPRAKLELRTKSAQLKSIIDLKTLPNIIISFSLNPEAIVKQYEHKTPSLKIRLNSINKLLSKNFNLGIHLDPVIYTMNFKEEYSELIRQLKFTFKDYPDQLIYLSIGTLRFVKESFQAVKKNYRDSRLLEGESIIGFDQKVRYPRPKRMWIKNFIRTQLMDSGFKPEVIYYCMEED